MKGLIAWLRPGMLASVLASVAILATHTAWAQSISGAGLPERVKWMYDESKWGLAQHYIVDGRFYMLRINGTEDWNHYIEHFDVDEYARRIYETGAGHVIFSLGQNSGFITTPSAVYDRNSPPRPAHHIDLFAHSGKDGGVKAQPGTNKADYTPERDLIADMGTALKKYNIRLLIYTPGHVPRRIDGKDGFPYTRPDWFAKDFFEELSKRWGDKVAGWWVDGSSGAANYDTKPGFPKTTKLANAMRSGNSDAVLAFNYYLMLSCRGAHGRGWSLHSKVLANTPHDDFTPGEVNFVVPREQGKLDSFQDCFPVLGDQGRVVTTGYQNRLKVQNHLYTPLGCAWSCPQSHLRPHGGVYLDRHGLGSVAIARAFVRYRAGGGVPTGDIPINLDGTVRLDALKMSQIIGNRMRTTSDTTYSGLRFINDNDSTATPGAYHKNGRTRRSSDTSGDWKQDMHEVSANGVEWRLDFKGPSVVIAGPRAPDQGEVEIFIDEVSQGRFSTHSKYQRMNQSIIFERHDLSDGEHTLSIVKRSGDKMRLDMVGVRRPVPPGRYWIRNLGSGKYLDLNSATSARENGKQIIQWSIGSFSDRFLWTVREPNETANEQAIYIVSSGSNVSLNVDTARTADDTSVIQWQVDTKLGTPHNPFTEQTRVPANSRWFPEPNADGSVTLRSALGGRRVYLAVKDSGTADGAHVVVHGTATGDNAKWVFEPVKRGFGQEKVYGWEAPSTNSALLVRDYNGDGKADLGYWGTADKTVTIRYGDGKGNFAGQTEAAWAANVSADKFLAADFNADGKADVAGIDALDRVFILYGDGAGNFSGQTISRAWSAPGAGAKHFMAADFNADDKADIAFIQNNQVFIRYGDGAGNFANQTAFALAGASATSHSFVAADFNGDGAADLAWRDSTAKKDHWTLRYGSGDGTFPIASQWRYDWQGAASAARPFAADMDGDGLADLGLYESAGHAWRMRTNNRDFGNFGGTSGIDRAAPDVRIAAPARHAGGGFTATFSFSEAVTGFALSDIGLGATGTASNLTGAGRVWTATIRPANRNTAVRLNLAAGAVSDAAGNGNTAATEVTVAATAPTLTIDAPGGHDGTAFSATFTFGEAVTGFSASDIGVSGGRAGNFSGSGSSYTATITPAANNSADVTLSVAAAVATNTAGNGNLSAVARIPGAPTLAIDAPDSHNGGSFRATFDFSESVTGFTLDDIAVTNGRASGFSGRGARYTASIMPASANSRVVLAVAAAAARDSSGNDSAAATLTVAPDTTAPTLIIDAPTAHKGTAFPVTFVFSEPVAGFSADDIDANATVSGLSEIAGRGIAAGTTWRATLTPASSGADVALGVAADAAWDAAGNGNRAARRVSVRADNRAPGVVITAPAQHNGSAFTATFTFSEMVSGFDAAADISVTGGSAAAPTRVPGRGARVYRARIIPARTGPRVEVKLNVAAGVARDAVGNGNTAAAEVSVTTDTQRPQRTHRHHYRAVPTRRRPLCRHLHLQRAGDGLYRLRHHGRQRYGQQLRHGSGTGYTATITPDQRQRRCDAVCGRG